MLFAKHFERDLSGGGAEVHFTNGMGKGWFAFPGFLEEPDRKYYFECDTAEQCQEWIEVLRRAR